MNIDIRLVFEYGYKWFNYDGIYVKGFAFDEDTVLRKGQDLLRFYEGVISKDDFLCRTKKLNGQFSIIYNRNGQLYLGVDPCRNFPLFYHKENNNIYISDSVEELAKGKFKWTELQKKEFLCTGFVTNKFTLAENVFQVQAGSIVSVVNGVFIETFYHHFNKVSDNTSTLMQVIDNLSQRLLSVLNGRTAVIPLSGGYDSRLLVCLLKKIGHHRVICYSYGIPSSSEVKISKRVASKLGFQWFFIPCDRERMEGFPESKSFEDYYSYASNYVSGFYSQEFFVVNYLQQNRMVPEDSVFIPGHSGDTISGSHLFSGIKEGNLLKLLFKKHYNLSKGGFEVFRDHISLGVQADIEPFENFDNWNLKERQSKYIINSCRMYEYFNYEYYLPLLDKELLDFYGNVDFEQRLLQQLYIKTLFKYYFTPMGVAIKKRSTSKMNLCYIISEIYRRGKRILYTDDYNCKMTAKVLKKHTPIEIEWNSTTININSIQALWYIKQIEKKYS